MNTTDSNKRAPRPLPAKIEKLLALIERSTDECESCILNGWNGSAKEELRTIYAASIDLRAAISKITKSTK